MKTLLIIGAGPGISHSTAERFAKEGFRVLLASRNANNVSELIKKLERQGTQVKHYQVDATNVEEVNNLITGLDAEYEGIDVLHYNAASLRHETIEQQSAATFVKDLDVNIGGALVAVKKAYEKMKSRKAGKILLTGGGFALQPHPEYLSLSIGKAGIRTIAQGLFESFKESGVHIASVTVATFVTPGSAEANGVAESFWQLYQQSKDEWVEEIIYSA